jgi:hypothetical protein
MITSDSHSSYEDVNEAIKQVFDQLETDKDDYINIVHKNEEEMQIFLGKEKVTSPDSPSFLCILKKWNSFSPIIPSDSEKARKGGGYYLYCNEYGLVIDPGFNFIQNFFEQGFKLADINGILISHAHNDHSIELESICSLLNKKNKYGEEEEKQENQQIDLFLNLGSFKKYAALFDLGEKGSPNYLSKIILLNAHQFYKIKDNFCFVTTETKHNEVITASYGLGFVFKCNKKLIRLTSDTGWNTKIEEENLKVVERTSETDEKFDLDSISVLITHVGTIKEGEFKYDFNLSLEENERGQRFYENHLGLLGCICMIKKWKPNLTILSEFGEELNKLRIPLAKILKAAMGTNVLPGDIGMVIDIDQELCFCQKSGVLAEYDDIHIQLVNNQIIYMAESQLTKEEKEYELHNVETTVAEKPKRFADYIKNLANNG